MLPHTPGIEDQRKSRIWKCPQPRSPGWCATCVPGANAGQAGYCDPALEDIDVSFQIYAVILVPTRSHSFLSRSTTMNMITKTRKKNLFFTIMLGASVIQNVLSERKTFLPWICKRCLFVSKSISGQNPHLQVKLWILSEEECRNRTWTHSKAKFRAMVDRSDFDLISKLCSCSTSFCWHVGILSFDGLSKNDGILMACQ